LTVLLAGSADAVILAEPVLTASGRLCGWDRWDPYDPWCDVGIAVGCNCAHVFSLLSVWWIAPSVCA
jgi:hypothetical protein